MQELLNIVILGLLGMTVWISFSTNGLESMRKCMRAGVRPGLQILWVCLWWTGRFDSDTLPPKNAVRQWQLPRRARLVSHVNLWLAPNRLSGQFSLNLLLLVLGRLSFFGGLNLLGRRRANFEPRQSFDLLGGAERCRLGQFAHRSEGPIAKRMELERLSPRPGLILGMSPRFEFGNLLTGQE